MRLKEDEPAPKLGAETERDAGQVGGGTRELPYSVQDELVLSCPCERRHPGRGPRTDDHTPRW
jgi:hypothetical protein